jgi:Cu-Zn family superoxide dismutase
MDHYNPTNVTHGAQDGVVRHVGDLGNVDTDAEGRIITRLTDDAIQLFGQYSIIGRSVVLHEKEDDLGNGGVPASLTTGNAGARIACGVVGLN